jgi:hypothetical protein
MLFKIKYLKEKSRRGAADRLYRAIDRYVGMKRMALDCIDGELIRLNKEYQDKLSQTLAKIPMLLERNQKQAQIETKNWENIKKEMQHFEDKPMAREMAKVLQEEKRQLQKALSELDKTRKEKVKKLIPDIYTSNQVMKELVRGKIVEDAEDFGGEVLSLKLVDAVRAKIAENLAKIATAEQDRPGAKEMCTKINSAAHRKINDVILPSLKDATEKMRGIHYERARKHVEAKLEKAIDAYKSIKKEDLGKVIPFNYINFIRNYYI